MGREWERRGEWEVGKNQRKFVKKKKSRYICRSGSENWFVKMFSEHKVGKETERKKWNKIYRDEEGREAK